MYESPSPQRKPKNGSKWGLWVLGIVFVICASILAYGTFTQVRNTVSSLVIVPENPFTEPLISEPTPTPLPVPEKYLDVTVPLQTEGGPPPQPWDGTNPVTLLLLGVDRRPEGTDPPHTDTIMLVTLDPYARTAAMISIPPDLWVEIPNWGYQPIGQAYTVGETQKLPQGGAGIALATVESLFDISIPYYALLNFTAFERVIDEIGGVKIEIPAPLVVDPLGDHNSTQLKPGVQTLPGNLALAYVRAADSPNSQLDRALRGQQIIFGVRKRIIDFQIFPRLMESAPRIYAEIASGLQTNLNLQQVVQLSWLTTQIPMENIRSATIGPDQVLFVTSLEGQPIRQPIPEEIFNMRDQILLAKPPPYPVAAESLNSQDPIALENAQIEIRNGTQTPGLGAATAEFLAENDLWVAQVTNADQIYPQTTLIDFTGKPYTVRFVADLLQIAPNTIFQRFDPEPDVDILILLGEDWAAQQ